MPNDHFRYALELLRDDGASAGQFAVEIDWEPLRQCARFAALQRGEQAIDDAIAFPARPEWDETLGKPYLSGFRLGEAGARPGAGEQVIPTGFLRPRAATLALQLIDEGKLERDAYSFRVLAYPQSGPEPARYLIDATAMDAAPTVSAGDLGELLTRATRCGEQDAADVPVFMPRRVLDECRQLTATAGGVETGGILIGGLSRDAATGEIFLRITAQIAARYNVAAEASLAFTPATWTQVQGAIDLRRRDEIMLGWWHSHPIKAWCASCPPEKRRKCPLVVDYFSAQDRLLHRTVFPAAYSVALVINELADDERTVSMFGWSQGMVVQRGFHVLDGAGPAVPRREAGHKREAAR